MIKKVNLRLLPEIAANDDLIRDSLSRETGLMPHHITGFTILKRSIDARSRQVYVNLTVNAFIDEPFHTAQPATFSFKDVSASGKKVIIIGAGPAGIFAALKLI